MIKLLRNDTEFCWDNNCEEAFESLRTILCNPPLLQFQNFELPFNVTIDASCSAIGGVLSQGELGKDRPIAFTSRVLRGPELAYEVYEKEALAMLHCIQLF